MKTFSSILLLFLSIPALSQDDADKASFTDSRDGKTYKVARIGKQVWMGENLAFKADSNCWAYDDNPDFVPRYGYLYTWEAAQIVCPKNWRLPAKEDYEILLNHLSASGKSSFKQIVSKGRSGFGAIFGGWFGRHGYFDGIDNNASYWTSTSYGHEYAFELGIHISTQKAGIQYGDKGMGASVRCIKIE
jgi:uncharacterized protein (TIGR02145 family)